MLQQALATLGLLVVLLMAADMLLVALKQRAWLASWAQHLRRPSGDERARARRWQALRLQRQALGSGLPLPHPGALLHTAGRHNRS